MNIQLKILILLQLFILLLLSPDRSFGAERVTIHGEYFDAQEVVPGGENQTHVRLLQDARITGSKNSIYMVLHKTEAYLKKLYPVIKREFYRGRLSYQDFLKTPYAFDCTLDNKSGALTLFTAKAGTRLMGQDIPEGVSVACENNRLAWLIDKEIEIKSLSLKKYTGNRVIPFAGKKFNTAGKGMRKRLYIGPKTIEGFLAETPLKAHGCKWTNAKSTDLYGIRFNKNLDIIAARLYSGTMHGFSGNYTYFLWEAAGSGMPGIQSIRNTSGNIYYGYSEKHRKNLVHRPITWNRIKLKTGDTLDIDLKAFSAPEDSIPVYTLTLPGPRALPLFAGSKYYHISTKEENIRFYKNRMPFSFTIAKKHTFKTGKRSRTFKARSSLEFYNSGKLKSATFRGIIPVTWGNKTLRLYHYVSFFEQGGIQEGILSQNIKLDLVGKIITVPKDSFVGFTQKGSLETVTIEAKDGSAEFYYVPQVSD
ncbi:MAG: hypothetical protein GY754_08710 [bacterium]|nr:hypothetical protein [bacterium]